MNLSFESKPARTWVGWVKGSVTWSVPLVAASSLTMGLAPGVVWVRLTYDQPAEDTKRQSWMSPEAERPAMNQYRPGSSQTWMLPTTGAPPASLMRSTLKTPVGD